MVTNKSRNVFTLFQFLGKRVPETIANENRRDDWVGVMMWFVNVQEKNPSWPASLRLQGATGSKP